MMHEYEIIRSLLETSATKSVETLQMPSPRKIMAKMPLLHNSGEGLHPKAQYAYHGTTENELKNMHAKGIKKLSFTGNPDDATFYAFQRAKAGKSNGVVLQIHTKHLKAGTVGPNDDETHNHIFYKGQIDPNHLKIVRHIPYAKTFGAEVKRHLALHPELQKVDPKIVRTMHNSNVSYSSANKTADLVRGLRKNGWTAERQEARPTPYYKMNHPEHAPFYIWPREKGSSISPESKYFV
jgi:hypothetical protein